MPGHFHNMVRSTFDLSLYAEVTTQRARRTVGYFALVVVMLAVVLSVANVFSMKSFIKRELVPELAKFPVITIKDHLASANVPQPWMRSIEEKSKGMTMVVIIDTTGQTTGFQPDQQGFILTRTHLLTKGDNPNMPQIDLKDVDDLVVDAKLVKHWADAGVWIIAGSMLVLRPIYHAGAKLFTALLLSLLGLIVASATGKRLRYSQIFSIGLYALTPAILVETVLDVVGVSVPHFWIAYFLVACVYTGLAIAKLRDAAAPPTLNFPSGTIQPRNYG